VEEPTDELGPRKGNISKGHCHYSRITKKKSELGMKYRIQIE
jgi:hypothetical protein